MRYFGPFFSILAILPFASVGIAQHVLSTDAPDGADVVFNYGANIDLSILDRHIRGLERRGITAIAVQELEAPNCVSLVVLGIEQFRFSADDIQTPRMSVTAVSILEGRDTGLIQSTCDDRS